MSFRSVSSLLLVNKRSSLKIVNEGPSLTIVNEGSSLKIVNEGLSFTIINKTTHFIKTVVFKTTVFEKRFLKKRSFSKTISSFFVFCRRFPYETIIFQKKWKLSIPTYKVMMYKLYRPHAPLTYSKSVLHICFLYCLINLRILFIILIVHSS